MLGGLFTGFIPAINSCYLHIGQFVFRASSTSAHCCLGEPRALQELSFILERPLNAMHCRLLAEPSLRRCSRCPPHRRSLPCSLQPAPLCFSKPRKHGLPSAWGAPPRISGTFTTARPRRRGGEHGQPSSCCRLMMPSTYLKASVVGTSPQRSGGHKPAPSFGSPQHGFVSSLPALSFDGGWWRWWWWWLCGVG